jgi:hypothetical protein
MPATSIRDLVIHNDDVVVGTHGRSFWILDDITPLRQYNATLLDADIHLFAPQEAIRVQRNVNTDTPLPPEEPAGQNPPDGAIIDYYLRREATPVTLEIFDSKNQLVRRFSSDDKPDPVNMSDYPVTGYWLRPPQVLGSKAGMQRFVWDLKYAPPPAFGHGFPIAAIYRDTPLYPLGPVVLPGTYTVKLTANGVSRSEQLTVQMDPRVKTGLRALTQQFNLSLEAYRGMQQTFDTVEEIKNLRAQIKQAIERADRGPLAEALNALDKKAAAIAGEGRGEGGLPSGTIDIREPNLTRLNNGFSSLLDHLQSADLAPTVPTVTAATELQKVLTKLMADWSQFKTKDVAAINEQLRAANQPVLNP